MKLLIGGSPCTHWSIAQTKHRETEPSGLGWELFLNYLIAREKYRPDYFLYENNKSMSPAIRAQITRELGVEPILINSALVSAQSRQRLYWTNIPGVEQPEDRGILVRDILESGVCWKDKAYTLKASAGHQGGPSNIIRCIETNGHFSANGVAEPVNITADGKAQCLRATYYKDGIRNLVGNTIDRKTCVAVRVGDMPNGEGEIIGSQSKRIYSVDGKSVPLQARPNGGGADGAATGLYAVPTGIAWRGRDGGRPPKPHGDYSRRREGAPCLFRHGRIYRNQGEEVPDQTSGRPVYYPQTDRQRVQTPSNGSGMVSLQREPDPGLQNVGERLDGGRDQPHFVLLPRPDRNADRSIFHV